jgi:hypothetical protein
VAQMQGACHIGRGNNHHELLSVLHLNRLEKATVLPPGIPAPGPARASFEGLAALQACDWPLQQRASGGKQVAARVTCCLATGPQATGCSSFPGLMPCGSQDEAAVTSTPLLQVL